MALNCFRYLDFKSFAEVDRLTIPEYNLLMQAVRLKMVDQDYRNHLQAFLNFSVQAKRSAGKGKERPVFSRFRKFYDYEKEIDKAKGKARSDGRLSNLSKLLKERGAKKDGD